MALKLEREWPEKWAGLTGARPYLQGTVQLADFTYQSVRFLCADKPENPARKLEFAVSVPPLRGRFSTASSPSFFCWRTSRSDGTGSKSRRGGRARRRQRLRTAYGDDPRWTEWLKELDGIVRFLKQEAAITPAEEANPKLIQWFPNPGKMPTQTTG